MAAKKPKSKSKMGSRTGLTVPRVEEALRKAAGMKTIAARLLNIGRRTLYDFLDANPSLKDIGAEIDEELGDLAESKLLQKIRDGDGESIRFYLRTKHKARGYANDSRVTATFGGDGDQRTTKIEVEYV